MADTYEIVNPSDPYTIRGEREAVFAAIVLLSDGAYGARSASDIAGLPILAFHRDPLAWWREQFGRGIDESLRALEPQIADALATVTLGRPDDAERGIVRRERSSMNDIRERAILLAAGIRTAIVGRARQGGARG